MGISLIELLKTTSDPVQAGVIRNIITADQLSAVLPFEDIGSDHVTYVREAALPATSTPSTAATITEDNTAADDRMSSYVRRFVIDQSIDNLDARGAGGMVNARAKAIAKAAKSLGRKYGTDVINANANWTVTVQELGSSGISAATISVGPGHDSRQPIGSIKYTHSGTTVAYKAPGDADYGTAVTYSAGVRVYSQNPNKWITVTFTGTRTTNGITVFSFAPTSSSVQIDGLIRLLPSAQLISSSGTNGDAIALSALDQLIDAVKADGQKMLVMPARTRRSIDSLLRSLGGVTTGEQRSQFSPSIMGTPMPSYNGVPICVTDWMPVNRAKGSLSNGTMVFCVAVGGEGITGIYSGTMPGEEESYELISQGANGITVLNLGTSQTADTRKVRVKAYWGLKLGSDYGIAALDEITN